MSSSRRARSNTPPRRRLDLTSLPYDADQAARATNDANGCSSSFFPDHEAPSGKMFTPRINHYRNLHRPQDIFDTLHSAGMAKQEKDRSIAGANSFLEIAKIWEGFRTKPPASGTRPAFNVFSSVQSHAQPASASIVSRSLWKKQEEENEKQRREFEARQRRFARAPTPPPVSLTASSANKVQAKVPVLSTTQIMPRCLSTPYTREQEKSMDRTELSVRRQESPRMAAASIQQLVQRLTTTPVAKAPPPPPPPSSQRPRIDATAKPKSSGSNVSAVAPAAAAQKKPSTSQQPQQKPQQQTTSATPKGRDSSVAHDEPNASVVRQPSAETYDYGLDSVTFTIEASPSPPQPQPPQQQDGAGAADAATPAQPNAATSNTGDASVAEDGQDHSDKPPSSDATAAPAPAPASESKVSDAPKAQDEPKASDSVDSMAKQQQETAAAPKASSEEPKPKDEHELLLEELSPKTSNAPRRRFKELEVE